MSDNKNLTIGLWRISDSEDDNDPFVWGRSKATWALLADSNHTPRFLCEKNTREYIEQCDYIVPVPGNDREQEIKDICEDYNIEEVGINEKGKLFIDADALACYVEKIREIDAQEDSESGEEKTIIGMSSPPHDIGHLHERSIESKRWSITHDALVDAGYDVYSGKDYSQCKYLVPVEGNKEVEGASRVAKDVGLKLQSIADILPRKEWPAYNKKMIEVNALQTEKKTEEQKTVIGMSEMPSDAFSHSSRSIETERWVVAYKTMMDAGYLVWCGPDYSQCEYFVPVSGNKEQGIAVQIAKDFDIKVGERIDLLDHAQLSTFFEKLDAINFTKPQPTKQDKFGTGAIRSPDADNVRYDLVSPIALERLAMTCCEGSEKYSAYNWESGLPISDLLNHAIRHQYLYLSGDRSEDHLAHAAWGLFAAMHSEVLWPHLNKQLRTEGCKPPVEENE